MTHIYTNILKYINNNRHNISIYHYNRPPAGLEAYWIWKPYVILKYLSNYASYGDVVCYVDSRYEFSKYIMDWIIDLLSKPPHIAIPLHKPGEGLQKERWFSSGDIYILMNMNNEETKESLQAWAGFNCYRVSFTTIRFVSEWLTYLQDPRIANGQYTLGEPRDPANIAHRQDQSVLSLMGKKWGANFFNISGQFYNCRGGGCHDT